MLYLVILLLGTFKIITRQLWNKKSEHKFLMKSLKFYQMRVGEISLNFLKLNLLILIIWLVKRFTTHLIAHTLRSNWHNIEFFSVMYIGSNIDVRKCILFLYTPCRSSSPFYVWQAKSEFSAKSMRYPKENISEHHLVFSFG